jgi:general secretion pathway protein B
MSYILDALRKADSERERGAIPGIHAQPVPHLSDDGTRAARWPALHWASAGLIALLLALLVWRLLERDPQRDPPHAVPPATPIAAPAPVTSPVATAPATESPRPPAANMAPSVTPSAAAPPAPPTAPAPTPATTESARPPAPVSARSEGSAQATKRHAAATRQVTAKAAPEAPTKPASRRSARKEEPAETESSPSGPIYQLKDLPEGIRRELPNLPIGGSVYSKSATDRLLIIHGQLFHEGDTLAPGLVLEQIRLKSAVLGYKGYRYEVSF